MPEEKKVISLREQILTADDIQKEIITVPEWKNVKLEIRGLTGAQRGKLMALSSKVKGELTTDVLYPELLIACVYDPKTGKRVFERSDQEVINQKSGGVLEKIAKIAAKLSGISQDDVEEAEKN